MLIGTRLYTKFTQFSNPRGSYPRNPPPRPVTDKHVNLPLESVSVVSDVVITNEEVDGLVGVVVASAHAVK